MTDNPKGATEPLTYAQFEAETEALPDGAFDGIEGPPEGPGYALQEAAFMGWLTAKLYATPAAAAEIVPLTDELLAALKEWIEPFGKAAFTADSRISRHRALIARAALATQAAPAKDQGVPASPSGSSLQPPSSASAAIPDAWRVAAEKAQALINALWAEKPSRGGPWVDGLPARIIDMIYDTTRSLDAAIGSTPKDSR